jgi:hypothetical protein
LKHFLTSQDSLDGDAFAMLDDYAAIITQNPDLIKTELINVFSFLMGKVYLM